MITASASGLLGGCGTGDGFHSGSLMLSQVWNREPTDDDEDVDHCCFLTYSGDHAVGWGMNQLYSIAAVDQCLSPVTAYLEVRGCIFPQGLCWMHPFPVL